MIDLPDIRDSRPADVAALETLYPDAFPAEDLLPLVKDLLNDERIRSSLVAVIDGAVVGHVIFTHCGLKGRSERVALLGPLAVASKWQRKGLGRALVQTGLQRLRTGGTREVFVLGDPAYYSKLGFLPTADVAPPYALPPAWHGAWQVQRLEAAASPLQGGLAVPDPWLKPQLWMP
ncbi:MAG: GNAT family N-acetyltransferase [Aestuariivirga sp.]